MISPQARTAYFLLRLSAAFAFLYPPLAALFGDPYSWLGYFPSFATAAAASLHVPELVLLHGFGLLEAAIALWILSGYKIAAPCFAGALLLVAIVLFNGAQFDILFRDLSLAGLLLALALMQGRATMDRYEPNIP